MSRLEVRKKSKAQLVVDNLYEDLERRIIASPPGLCPVDMTASFLKLFMHRLVENAFHAVSAWAFLKIC